MAQSAVSGDVYLPVLCGGTLDAGPSNGAVAQNVRGCSAIAVIDDENAITYWEIVLDDQTVPPELCVVLTSVAGLAHEPPYFPSWEWDGQGTLRLTTFVDDGESGMEQTLTETVCFSILFIPNR